MILTLNGKLQIKTVISAFIVHEYSCITTLNGAHAAATRLTRGVETKTKSLCGFINSNRKKFSVIPTRRIHAAVRYPVESRMRHVTTVERKTSYGTNVVQS